MLEILKSMFLSIKENYTVLAMLVFVVSGIYLLIIDGSDLSTKKLKRELKMAKILGTVYILGSIAVFILFQFIL